MEPKDRPWLVYVSAIFNIMATHPNRCGTRILRNPLISLTAGRKCQNKKFMTMLLKHSGNYFSSMSLRMIHSHGICAMALAVFNWLKKELKAGVGVAGLMCLNF